MNAYTEPILWAVIIFPFVAMLFTAPYVLVQYHKYGAIPMIRVGIVYSFILYLIAAYFLVILPLPSQEEVAMMTGSTTQLVPFAFITDFIRNTSFVLSDPSTYLKAFTEPYIYQVLYNVLLFVPFGIYLRYYFNCSFKKTLFLSFLLTLFFELTQLSGLYGIYPRGYRLFDIDDLMLNTLGGIIGYFIAAIVTKVLPSRNRIDEISFQKGTKITVWKRLVGFFLDLFLASISSIFVGVFFRIIVPNSARNTQFMISITTFVLYFLIIPVCLNGATLGKKFLNMKLVTLDQQKPKFYQYFVRYLLLFGVVVPFPIYLAQISLVLIGIMRLDQSVLLLFLLFILGCITFFYYFYLFVKMAQKKLLWYEKVSKTCNVSTIRLKSLKHDQNLEKEETIEKEVFYEMHPLK